MPSGRPRGGGAARKVALLRGINVGKANRVAMADLRAIVEHLGYTDVTTVLNSGNVVFTAPRGVGGDPGARIEKALAARLGVSSRVTVLGAPDVAAIVAENSLGAVADNPSRLLVTVLSNPADRKKLQPLTMEDWTPEALAVGTRAAYLWCANGIVAGRLADAVGRVLGDAATSRNWATMLKLRDLIGSRGVAP